MESKGKTFRRLLQDEPYLFTGGIYSPLDAQIAEQAGMKSIYLSGYSLAMLNGWPDMGFLTMTEVTKAASMVASAVEVPDHRGRRRRLRQRALDHAHGAGVREDRSGGHPPRGPALPEALRPHRGEDDRVARGGARQVPVRPRGARPARPRLRDHRAHRRLRGGGREHGGGDLARPGLRRRGRGSRLGRAVELGPGARDRVRAGHEGRRTRTCPWPSTTPPRSAGTRTTTRSPSASSASSATASSSSRSSEPTPRCTRCGTSCRSW